MAKAKKLKYWDPVQIRDFVREAKNDVGIDGWNMLVDRARRALIAEKVLKIAFVQSTWPSKEVVIELREAMLAQAGLGDGTRIEGVTP